MFKDLKYLDEDYVRIETTDGGDSSTLWSIKLDDSVNELTVTPMEMLGLINLIQKHGEEIKESIIKELKDDYGIEYKGY